MQECDKKLRVFIGRRNVQFLIQFYPVLKQFTTYSNKMMIKNAEAFLLELRGGTMRAVPDVGNRMESSSKGGINDL
jgi:hypothetical protein